MRCNTGTLIADTNPRESPDSISHRSKPQPQAPVARPSRKTQSPSFPQPFDSPANAVHLMGRNRRVTNGINRERHAKRWSDRAGAENDNHRGSPYKRLCCDPDAKKTWGLLLRTQHGAMEPELIGQIVKPLSD